MPGSPIAGATLVVGIGSNASPHVLQHKFIDAGLEVDDLERRLVGVRVAGLGVAHSAHVARRGYIPAGPYRQPGAELATTAAWLEPAHLAVLDATEPNYHRMIVSSTFHPVRVGGTPHAFSGAFCLYVSRHGVLGDGPTALAPFSSQEAILRWLGERIRPALPAAADAAAACCALADPDGGRRLFDGIHAAGLAHDARLAYARVAVR
ncbi:hypothetical protein ACLQ3C_18995 [Gordonia sp. DT30]|uniref:hypothetical protein n=1 Tax=unclassified Gordonia (in: high G+C Gram-positive bacteria) TaxID=2657482 RepID=UPI003CFAB73A